MIEIVLKQVRYYAEKLEFNIKGYFDVISLHDCGVRNVVASMGTAIGLEQLRLAASPAHDLVELFSEGISSNLNEVILLLDSDQAGVNAVRRLCTHIFLNTINNTKDVEFIRALANKLRIASITSLSNLKTQLPEDESGMSWQALSEAKDASDLCVSVRNLVVSKQLSISVSSVMHNITDAALDWRLWMIDR